LQVKFQLTPEKHNLTNIITLIAIMKNNSHSG
jgi:hypothetical protein